MTGPAVALPNVRAVSRPAAMRADTVTKMTAAGTVADSRPALDKHCNHV
jgi:hypothetical protein